MLNRLMNHLLHVSAEAPQPVPPFTNILSEELVFNKRHIITFGFQLQTTQSCLESLFAQHSTLGAL
jgi:hypothetical protein